MVKTISLAGFDLLRDSRQDIRELPWAHPARREAMTLYFSILRSRKEIYRLNVEIRCLITFMVDDHVDYYRAIASCIIPAPHLAHLLLQEWQYCNQIHGTIIDRLVLTSRLQGFTGSLLPGSRIGRDQTLGDGIPLPAWASKTLHLLQIIVGSDDPEQEDVPRELEDIDAGLLVELIEKLHT